MWVNGRWEREQAGYVYVDIAGRDVGGYVEDAKKAVTHAMALYEKLFSYMHRQKPRS